MSSKKILLSGFLLAAILVIPFACKTTKTPALDCSTTEASFSKDIQPLVIANCMPCHKAGSPKGDFTTYEGLNAVAKSGDLELHALKKKDMPPKGPLSESDCKKLQCWLNNGAKNN